MRKKSFYRGRRVNLNKRNEVELKHLEDCRQLTYPVRLEDQEPDGDDGDEPDLHDPASKEPDQADGVDQLPVTNNINLFARK